MLYRTIIGEPGRNEYDLSHCPVVSGSLEASVVAEVQNVSAPGETRWLGNFPRVHPRRTTLVAARPRRYWVTFSPTLPSPAGTRYTRVAYLHINVGSGQLSVGLHVLVLHLLEAPCAAVSPQNIIGGGLKDLLGLRLSIVEHDRRCGGVL